MNGTPKILTLDIETSPLQVYTWGLWQQNISIGQIIEPTRMLSWAAKWHGKKPVLFASEYHDGAKTMVKQIHALLDEADVVVHFNGGTFDMPHLRREFALLNLPPYSPVQEIDLLKIVKNRFRFPSNKLDYVTKQFDLDHKLGHTGFSLWRDCLAGDDKAWSLMRKYNKQDVVITEQLYDKLRPYMVRHPHMGLFSGEDCCSRCGSTDLAPQGFAYTALATYQRYKCRNCKSWSRGGKAVEGAGARGVA
jgi:uncharacterized protein